MSLDGEKTKIPPSSIAHLTDEERAILMPEWSSSQEDDDKYMIGAEGLSPAPVEGQRLVAMVPDGVRAVEVSVPHLPYENWISPEGNVHALVVKTNRVRKKGSSIDTANYGATTKAHKYKMGWLNFKTGGLGESKSDWLKRREGEIARRQHLQRQRTEESEAELNQQNSQKANELKQALVEAIKSSTAGDEDRARRAKVKDDLKKGR